MGELIGIAKRPRSRAPVEELSHVTILDRAGLEGDHGGRYKPRAVTVLCVEDWQRACDAAGTTLPWTTRRANLLVRGMELAGLTGRHLVVGGALLEISGETEPCERMDAAYPGLRAALTPDWRGGVTCKVLRGGVVALGDAVEIAADLLAS